MSEEGGVGENFARSNPPRTDLTDLVKRWRDAATDPVLAEASRENQAAGDSIVSYVLIVFAVIQVRDVARGANFLAVLSLFVLFFLSANYLKAYLTHVAGGASRSRSVLLLNLFPRAISFGLTYVTFLLVQIAMKRAEPAISDGHWSPLNLLLPVLLFVLLYVVWHTYAFRSEEVASETEESRK